jgi:hypothetical protein
MPDYRTHSTVQLIHGENRFEIRTCIFLEFGDGKATREEALKVAEEIARAERARTGALP